MKQTKSAKWNFLDGVARNAEYPNTFEIPSAKKKSKIDKGYWVKVGFESENWGGERMWVYVIERLGDLIRGSLDNTPVCYPKSTLKHGQILIFTVDHVLGIMNPQRDPL